MSNYRRINKAAARRLFNEGKEFWIAACNMRPECGLLINCKVGYVSCEWKDFETFLNCFTYYNCNNETGRYPAYYVEE